MKRSKMVSSIFLISAAVLAYEIILMRIFSITQWYHFAYMIISIALLGFGASGTFIALFRTRLTRQFLASYRLFSFLFPLSMILSYFLSQQNEFNPFEIVWNPRQYFHLVEYYLVLFIPFFLAATCIGLTFTQYTNKIGLIYCYNLIGSGVGAIGAVGCLYFAHPVQSLYVIVGVALCGTGATFLNFRCEGREGRQNKEKHSWIFSSFAASMYVLIAFIIFLAVKYDPLNFREHLNISQYKGLSMARKFPDAKILAELVSPLGVVHAVSSPIIRNAPGLSLNYTGDIPSQIALFIDSGNAGVITYAKSFEKSLIKALDLRKTPSPTPLTGVGIFPAKPEIPLLGGVRGGYTAFKLMPTSLPTPTPPRRGIAARNGGGFSPIPTPVSPTPSHQGREIELGPLKGGLEFLDFLSLSLVYHVRPVSTVLILGAGGGTDVLNALYHRAKTVDAVELDANIIRLVREQFQDFSSDLYSRPNVRVIHQEARGYMETTRSTYDSIQISLLDSFSASSAGVYALNENYLYTVEALKRYYSCLTPHGILSITRWVKFPPRDNIKLFATAVEALEELGITNISKYLVSIRSWATCTLLVSKSPFTDEEITHIQTFCHERSFDTNYFSGIRSAETNIYNQIPSNEYYHAAQNLLFGNREAFYTSYPYFVRPARDDSPYFFHFFKWKTLPALLKTMGKEWIPFIEWGYLVLLATLLQAGVVSIILIIIPLFALPRRSAGEHGVRLGSAWYGYTLIYFTCLGLGYLFLEMVFIQKFILFLSNPVYAVSVIISSFLIFSGLGSLYLNSRITRADLQTPQSTTRNPHHAVLVIAVGGIIGCSFGYTLFLAPIFSYCLGWSNLSKILLTVVLIAPLGFCMGIPFPLGISRLHVRADELVPWAYGINGCASVLSSLMATCIAIPWGFRTVIFFAEILYVVAVVVTYLSQKV